MFKMIFTGMKRRRKEIRYVSVVTFTAVLFVTGMTLFQDIMNSYVFQNNLNTYGNWVVSSVEKKLSHPYFGIEGSCTTGMKLADEEGNRISVKTGTAGDAFEEIDGEALFEGRYPETENEIAMDAATLTMFGYSYKLGQTVTIHYYDAGEQLCSKEYQLVGILKSIGDIWKRDSYYGLPNVFFSEEEFRNYDRDSYTTYFYQLNPEYSEIDTDEFAESFRAEGSIIIYNSHVYENGIWGAAEVFDMVTCALMLVSVLSITYLLVAYTGKRREVYYKYRCIGATKGQVRKIIFTECVYATMPQILSGMLVTYAAVFIGVHAAAKIQKIPKFYEFDLHMMLWQLFAIAGVVFAAIICTQLGISDKRLAGNTKEVKPSKYKRLRRLALRTRCPERTIFKRQHVIRPVQTIAGILFSMVVSALLIFCVFKMDNSWYYRGWAWENTDDFWLYSENEVYRFEAVYDPNSEYHGLALEDMYKGAKEELLEEIRLCPGVKSMEYYWTDAMHYFKWEGMEESKALKELRKEWECYTPYEYKMSAMYYDDISKIRSYADVVSQWNDMQHIDWDAIENGEQAILVIGSSISELEDTIHAGDTIWIVQGFTGVSQEVEVAAVITQLYDSSSKNPDFTALRAWSTGSYKMIGSKALAERIAKGDGEELKISMIKIDCDSTASYETTDKVLSDIAVQNDLEYDTEIEFLRMDEKQLISDLGIYGSTFLMILMVYIMIQRSFLESKNKYWQERFAVLKQIGMENKQYQFLSFLEECKSFFGIFAGLIPGYGLILYYYYIENQGKYIWDTQSGEMLADGWEIALEYWKIETNHMLLLGIAAAIYLIMILSSVIVIRRSLQKEI